MSTQAAEDLGNPADAFDLTPLGKRVEMLRIERGVSKQRLARHAGTSRQQLWRVMTGKSELTSSLRERLATALSVEPANLTGGVPSSGNGNPATAAPAAALTSTAVTVSEYLTDAAHLAATIRTLPAGDGGRRLKRALLNALEDLAVDAERPLPIDYSEIRRRVLAGEL